MVWGLPQDIYLKLKAGYVAAEIPIRQWEPDNNFVVDYKVSVPLDVCFFLAVCASHTMPLTVYAYLTVCA